MKHDLLTSSLHPLPVAGEPGLQVVLVFRQPAGPAPYIHRMGVSRHGRNHTRARAIHR